MSAAAESIDERRWPDETLEQRERPAPRERLEQAVGPVFARRLIAALVGQPPRR
jgi:hypothetical protein